MELGGTGKADPHNGFVEQILTYKYFQTVLFTQKSYIRPTRYKLGLH